MPQKNRLTGVDIRSMRSPRRIHGEFFSVLVGGSSAKHPKCACVVSKKVAALAHDRNLVKRRCRAALTKGIAALPPGSYVFHAKKEAPQASFSALERDVVRLLRELARS